MPVGVARAEDLAMQCHTFGENGIGLSKFSEGLLCTLPLDGRTQVWMTLQALLPEGCFDLLGTSMAGSLLSLPSGLYSPSTCSLISYRRIPLLAMRLQTHLGRHAG